MALNVSQFQSSDNFNMAEFNDMISQINNGVNSEVAALTTLINNGAKIQTGSYVGTGTYGASNPCSLTFNKKPKFIMIQSNSPNSTFDYTELYMMNPVNYSRTIINQFATTDSYLSRVSCTWSDNSISWYSYEGTSSGRHTLAQMNATNITYYWFVVFE